MKTHKPLDTLEGSTAYIKAGKVYPIQNIQIYSSGCDYPTLSTSTEFIDATNGFAVTPRHIGQQALLDVSPWTDRASARDQFDTQKAQSNFRINLGEWVELGGIDETGQHSTYGNLANNAQTQEIRLRILVKVDKTDDWLIFLIKARASVLLASESGKALSMKIRKSLQ